MRARKNHPGQASATRGRFAAKLSAIRAGAFTVSLDGHLWFVLLLNGLPGEYGKLSKRIFVRAGTINRRHRYVQQPEIDG